MDLVRGGSAVATPKCSFIIMQNYRAAWCAYALIYLAVNMVVHVSLVRSKQVLKVKSAHYWCNNMVYRGLLK